MLMHFTHINPTESLQAAVDAMQVMLSQLLAILVLRFDGGLSFARTAIQNKASDTGVADNGRRHISACGRRSASWRFNR